MVDILKSLLVVSTLCFHFACSKSSPAKPPVTQKQGASCTNGICGGNTPNTTTTIPPNSNPAPSTLSWDLALNASCAEKVNLADKINQLSTASCDEGNEPGRLAFQGARADRPQEQHADLNIWLRGMICNNSSTALYDQNGDVDGGAPRIYSILSSGKSTTVKRAYSVYEWNWPSQTTTDSNGYKVEPGTRGGIMPGAFGPTTAAGFGTSAGAQVIVPKRPNSTIGAGYNVLVLYATPNQITLKYTAEDSVITGYTIQIAGVCVNQKIVAAFNQLKSTSERPALHIGDVIGKSLGDELLVMVRDTGTFMNPLERNHWWQD